MPGFSFAPGQTPGLEHTAYFTPQQASYCNGTHVVEVEVDPMTGGVDAPELHGGARQRQRHQSDDRRRPGAGRRRARHRQRAVRVDEVRRRRATADHHVPGLSPAVGTPTCRAVVIEHIETPNPLNPLGVKGAGEGGTIPAPAAIIAAIEDALSPFGVRFSDMPLTPDRIVEALRRAGAYETLTAA